MHAYLGESSGDGAEEEHGEGHDGGHRGHQGGRQVVSLGGWELAIFIGPESDHCLPLSLTHSLTH